MFENEAGEAECVTCGRRVWFKKGKFEVRAPGDRKAIHGFSTFPGFELNTKTTQD